MKGTPISAASSLVNAAVTKSVNPRSSALKARESFSGKFDGSGMARTASRRAAGQGCGGNFQADAVRAGNNGDQRQLGHSIIRRNQRARGNVCGNFKGDGSQEFGLGHFKGDGVFARSQGVFRNAVGGVFQCFTIDRKGKSGKVARPSAHAGDGQDAPDILSAAVFVSGGKGEGMGESVQIVRRLMRLGPGRKRG